MNNLEFRLWHEEKQKMFKVKSIDFNTHEISVLYKKITVTGVYTLLEHFPFIDVTLMQYTGLKDKNGKKIFVGDILLAKGRKFIVKEMLGQFVIESLFIRRPLNCECEKGEVIGTIYENKELLR